MEGALVKCRKVGAKNWGNKSKKKEGVNEAPQKYRVYVKQKAHVGGSASKKFSVEKFQTGGMYFDYKKGMDTIKKLRKMNSSADYKLVKESVNETVEMGKGVKKLMKIADEGYGKVGGVTVDGMSANLFKQLYDKANDDIKQKLNKKNEKQLVMIIGRMWKKFGKNVKIGSSL